MAALEFAGGDGMVRARRKVLEERVKALLAVFDDELRRRNCEYRSKRDDGRIDFPRAVALGEGSYERWRRRMAAEGKPESQVKQPVTASPPGPGRMPVKGCRVFDDMEIIAEF